MLTINFRVLIAIVLFGSSVVRAQFSAELLGVMAEAQRVASSGDVAAVAAYAAKNPGFVKEITQTALQAMPSNRSGVIAAVLKAMPSHASEVAVAAAKGAPASFGSELSQILAGRPASEVISIASKVAAAEPKVAITTTTVACAVAPQQAANIAAVIAPSVPQQAGDVVNAAASGSSALKQRISTEAGAVLGGIAAAVAEKVPSQAANIIQRISQSQGLLEWAKWADTVTPGAAGSAYLTRVLAMTAAAIVQSVPSSLDSVLVSVANVGQANGWTSVVGQGEANLAYTTGLLLSSLNPSASTQIVSTLSSLPGGTEASKSLVKTDMPAEFKDYYTSIAQAVSAAAQTAHTAVVQGSNVPSVPVVPSSAPATPTMPIDPSLVVSPSK